MYVGSRHQILFVLLSYVLMITLDYTTFHDMLKHLSEWQYVFQAANIALLLFFTYNYFACCFSNPGVISKDTVTAA
jgi:hypothetical protein